MDSLPRFGRHFGAFILLNAMLWTPATGQVITFDVRLAGGGKSHRLTSPGEVVPMELYAQIANGDSDHSNDGFLHSHGSILSTEFGPGTLMGDLSTFSLNGSIMHPLVSHAGYQANLDGNPDLEVGSSNTTRVNGFIVTATGIDPVFGTGVGSGATEILLGSFTWTASTSIMSPASVQINYEIRNRTDGNKAGKHLVMGTSDGELFAYNGGPHVPEYATVGAPVSIVINPEPSAMGPILGVLVLANHLIRRRPGGT